MDTLLQQIPLLSDLTPQERETIREICRPVVYPPGERIFNEGQKADFMLIIDTGEVWVFRETPMGEKVDLATMTHGAILGELALADGGKRSAYAQATTEVRAVQILRNDFLQLRAEMSPAAFKLMRKIAQTTCRRLREVNRKILAEVSGEPLDQGQQRGAGGPRWLGLWNKFFGKERS